MVHPLYASRNGARLYSELPPVYRHFDNQSGSHNAPNSDGRRLGDLEAFLHGFGHLLDRFDATLEQFYADGFISPVSAAGEPASIQGWLLPYVAQLFGVTLLGPDAASRQRELADSIWIARRRGTRVAIDRSAEAMLDLPVVVVAGAERILRAATTEWPPMTHREITGKWHPADALILHRTLPPFAAATHVSGFLATRPDAHAGLPVGVPGGGRHMRARRAAMSRPDIDLRPADASAGPLVAFAVEDRRGVPCFPASYEDRSLRTPDMRRPRANRPRSSVLAAPDAITLFVRPPDGIFTPATQANIVNARPVLKEDGIEVPAAHAGKPLADLLFRSANVLDLDPVDDADDTRSLTGLRFDGTIRITGDARVTLRDCAIASVTFTPDFTGVFKAENCIFDSFDFQPAAGKGPGVELIYVTVTRQARLPTVNASDCLFTNLTITGLGPGQKLGCIRYSRLQAGFSDAAIHLMRSSKGPVQFQPRPCLPAFPPVVPLALPLVSRVPVFGEPGYGVLADTNTPEVAMGAEDGGEVGVYHGAHHLARLAAAGAKAQLTAPAGRRIYAFYDPRLLPVLPA